MQPKQITHTSKQFPTGVTKIKNVNSGAGVRLRTGPVPISSGRMCKNPLCGGGTCSKALSPITGPIQHILQLKIFLICSQRKKSC